MGLGKIYLGLVAFVMSCVAFINWMLPPQPYAQFCRQVVDAQAGRLHRQCWDARFAPAYDSPDGTVAGRNTR